MHRCIPRHLPDLAFLLSELGFSADKAAKVLKVTERTVYNWLKSDKEPYAPRLALFWLTKYGYEIIHVDAHNSAKLYAGLARSQAAYIKRLEDVKLADVKKPRQAANDRVFGVVSPSTIMHNVDN